jgi:hypothetical protein
MVCNDESSVLQDKEGLACAVSRKLKAGSTVSTFVFPPEFLRQVRDLADRWGKMLATVPPRGWHQSANGLYGIEQFAAVVAAGLTEGTVASLLDKQAEELPRGVPRL